MKYVFNKIVRLLAFAALWFAAPAMAGEVQSLSWEEGATPAFHVKIAGEFAFEVESLEEGRRQRVSFTNSTMGAKLDELPARKPVKGVFPFLADNATTVNLDVLLTDAANLRAERVADGLRIVVEPPAVAAAAPAPAAAEPVQPARAAAGNAIEEMLYTKLPGDRVQLTLRMTRTPGEPAAFTITNPARISLDFADTRIALARKSMAVKEGALSTVTAVEAEGRTRIVLNLIKPVAYTTAVDGNNFVVTLQAPTAVAGTEAAKTTRFASARKDAKYNLKTVDFRRGPQGEGRVIITLSEPTVGIDIREQAGEIVLDFLNTSVSNELQRRLDVVDFATPVQTIDTFVQGRNTRMVITPKGRYEHVAYQAGNVFTVSIKPVIEKADEKKVDEFGYSGEKLSLNFQNIDVRAALQVLADFTGLNFVVSDTVRGSLTLRLKDVPWDQALDLIVDSKNLAVRRKGNVISVAPAAEVAAKEKAALEATKAVIELEPLVSELIRINYAKADELAALIKSIKPISDAAVQQHPVFGAQATGAAAPPPTTSTNSLLSPRGQVTVDARTNALLIQDTPGKIREIRKLIAQLDQPVRQVMIEARIVEATDSFSKSLGTRFGIKDTRRLPQATAGTGHGGAVSGSLADSSSIVAAGTLGADAGGLNVNLGATSVGSGGFGPGALALTIAKLGNAGELLNLEISALEQAGQGKVVSSPRVITANQKRAKIEQGQERVFTTSVLGAGGVVTKRATLKLEVTPQITPDDRINMDVKIAKDDFADAVTGILNVKDVDTQILLDNGETVVIGGIFEQNKAETITKVPFFGDLPLVGWMFRNKGEQDNRTELLIFLTPRILSERLGLR